MYNIKIETAASYVGKSDTYITEQGDKSISITHETKDFMHKKIKPDTKKLSYTEYRPIADAFENIDFQKVFKESGDLVGYDGWTLKVTLSNVMSGISVSLWCPSESPETPETTKLLQACDKVCSLFGDSLLSEEE